MVRRRRGTWFDPEIADAFLAIDDGDRLWASLAMADAPDVLAVHEPGEVAGMLVDDDLDRIAFAFADVIDAKSPFTADHSRGVARAAVAIGTVLGLSDAEIGALNRAALLHDIGKLGVSNAILDKRRPLTDDERVLVQQHPRFTEEILSRVAAFAPIAFVAGAHHERMDAKGYHRGIGADDLPRDARILAVADVFDALHADRPYRDGMPLERIMGIMHADSGTAFDPQMVAALVECVDDLVEARTPASRAGALDVADSPLATR
jgi:HD-GYP domain-containing protein (c-di-GMP phosphodiesterase class II)